MFQVLHHDKWGLVGTLLLMIIGAGNYSLMLIVNIIILVVIITALTYYNSKKVKYLQVIKILDLYLKTVPGVIETYNLKLKEGNDKSMQLKVSKDSKVNIYDADSEVNDLLNNKQLKKYLCKLKHRRYESEGYYGLIAYAFILTVLFFFPLNQLVLITLMIAISFVILGINHFIVKQSKEKIYIINQRIYEILQRQNNCDYLAYIFSQRIQEKNSLNKQFSSLITFIFGLFGGISILKILNFENIIKLAMVIIIALIILFIFQNCINDSSKWQFLAENANHVVNENKRKRKAMEWYIR